MECGNFIIKFFFQLERRYIVNNYNNNSRDPKQRLHTENSVFRIRDDRNEELIKMLSVRLPMTPQTLR